MSKTQCRTMSAFYDQCGAFISSHIVSTGAFPSVQHTAIFDYENGTATYDGKSWLWMLSAGGM